jgi:hypothetical protein
MATPVKIVQIAQVYIDQQPRTEYVDSEGRVWILERTRSDAHDSVWVSKWVQLVVPTEDDSDNYEANPPTVTTPANYTPTDPLSAQGAGEGATDAGANAGSTGDEQDQPAGSKLAGDIGADGTVNSDTSGVS